MPDCMDGIALAGLGSISKGGTSLLAGAEAGEHYFLVCVLGDGGELANVIPHRYDTPTTRSRPTRPAFPRVEHARLYPGLGDADYLGNSLTDLDRPRTSVPGRTSRHRKESAGR